MRLLLHLFVFLIAALSLSAQVAVETAPDFTVKDVDGNQHHLYDFLDNGKLVVIDFFTTNCGPCQTYASEVSASYEYFGCNYADVIYLGINWGSDNELVRQFDSVWGAYYPSVSGLQGGGNAVVDLYQVQSYPTVILIAPDRSILNNHIWPPAAVNINAEVLTAGGIPMSCTVNAGLLLPETRVCLQVLFPQGGAVNIVPSGLQGKVYRLTVHGTDGRLVFDGPPAASGQFLRLARGLYVATLTAEGRRAAFTKFIVR
jgi:thiol-disulfide isomerase/thioredoxin